MAGPEGKRAGAHVRSDAHTSARREPYRPAIGLLFWAISAANVEFRLHSTGRSRTVDRLNRYSGIRWRKTSPCAKPGRERPTASTVPSALPCCSPAWKNGTSSASYDPIDQFTINPGTALYHAGDQRDYMFTVRSGTFKLVQYLPDGGQRIFRLARTADVVGFRGPGRGSL